MQSKKYNPDEAGDIEGATNMKQGKLKHKWLLGLLAVVLAGAGFFYWNQQAAIARDKITYRTYTLSEREPLMLKGTAEVTESTSVFIDPSKGEVKDLLVTSGQRVKAGDPLFSYDNEMAQNSLEDAQRAVDKAEDALKTAKADLAEAKDDQAADKSSLIKAEANLDKAKSRLRNAQKDLEEAQADRDKDRIEDLNDTIYEQNEKVQEYSQDVSRLTAKKDSWPGQITALEKSVKQTETALDDAKIMLDRAESNQTNSETAPFDGVVLVHEENKTNPQGSLVDILSEQTKINAMVTEYDYFRLALNQDVFVHVIATDERIPGKIVELNPIPENLKLSGAVDSSVNYAFGVIPERRIQPGYSVEVEVALNEIVVPTSAIVKDKDQSFLWVVTEGKVARKPVKLEQRGNYWVLSEGLAKNSVIVVDPNADLTEGLQIQVEAK